MERRPDFEQAPGDQSAEDTLIGTWILDQYYIRGVIGEGGMGRIYLAEQSDMDRLAAIKVLSSRFRPSDETRRRFRKEARAVSRLAHTNIVTVYNFGELPDGSMFLAMEYIEGKSLDQVIADGPVDVDLAFQISQQCIAALIHAHARGVVHRDLKPGNVMLAGDDGEELIVKIVDFGIARMVESDHHTMTPTGDLLGTPRYISPEQARGEPATAMSDQYNLGLVIYEMFTGASPFQADTAYGYLQTHLRRRPDPPSEKRDDPRVAACDEILLRLLAKEPHERYPDLQSVTRALQRAQTKPLEAPVTSQVLAPQASGDSEQQERRTIYLDAATVVDNDDEPYFDRLGLDVVIGDKPAGEIGGHTVKPQSGGITVTPKELLLLDAAVDGHDAVKALNMGPNVVIGAHPLDPAPVALACDWIARGDLGGIERLAEPGATVQCEEIRDSTLKSQHVDRMLEDLRSARLRRPVLASLVELAEEMLLNAIFHAPVDFRGRRPFAALDRSERVTLPPHQAVQLRWVVDERYVALSVRDRFGSLEGNKAIGRCLTVPTSGPRLGRAGSGMGLHIMGKAADHLFFAICAEAWCEVLALVRRKNHRQGRRSVTVLRSVGTPTAAIGDRLSAHIRRDGDNLHIALRGEINETSDFSCVFQHEGTVHLDLSGVERINSVGVRAWFDAARERNEKLDLHFRACSLAWVRQLNMLPSLCDMGTIESILVPYYCERCDIEMLECIDTPALASDGIPERLCEEDDCPKEFDGLPAEYLAFLEPMR